MDTLGDPKLFADELERMRHGGEGSRFFISDPDKLSLEKKHRVFTEELRRRIEDSSFFHSRKDQRIAQQTFNKLIDRMYHQDIKFDVFWEAVSALYILTPKRNEQGFRTIGKLTVTPPMERTILSRLESQEIDITEPDKPWGELPEVVRKKIAAQQPSIQITGTCTVRCSFCALAEKGPIQRKISFQALEKLIVYIIKNNPLPPNQVANDTFYWGSDPFDAKWKRSMSDASGGLLADELDYSNLADMYWSYVGKGNRALYTSTAIPIGEEFRVLSFIQHLHERKQSKSIEVNNQIRISLTNANKERVDAIQKIILALFDNPPNKNTLYVSDNRDQHVARAGNKWQSETVPATIWDVIGPNCEDNIIIGADSVDAMMMQATSNERPMGEEHFPVKNHTNTGAIEYIVPSRYHVHHPTKPDLSDVFPNFKYTRFTSTDAGLAEQEETYEYDPHRAFLRILDLLDYFQTEKRSLSRVGKKDRGIFFQLLSDDLALVQAYLDSGAQNIPMIQFMNTMRKYKFFTDAMLKDSYNRTALLIEKQPISLLSNSR